ncbi:MAG: isoamylase early set domain-containing protein [Planctomycetota bacterium]|jgi:1,4-alpha-glucan branching enzyme
MITKKKTKGQKTTSVTFKTGIIEKAKTVEVVGDFNDWTAGKHQLKQRKGGKWSTTIRLPRKKQFQFRYLVDGQEWLTDEESDGLMPNEFGTTNALLET